LFNKDCARLNRDFEARAVAERTVITLRISAMPLTRRSFLGASVGAGALPFIGPGIAAAQKKSIPVGLELYSVRKALQEDLMGTVRKVGEMGYQDVEFFSPYYSWTTDQAKDVRKLLDDLGVKCLSTHNALANYKPENIQKAIDLNKILGTRFIVVASSPRAQSPDDWKRIAESLTEGADKLRSAGLRGGYHNHQTEFTPMEGKRPIEIIAAHTPKDFMLQLDVGTCVEMGSDPVAWINANPGRINSLHLKEWSKDKGYRPLFGEGATPWKQIFAAAEKTGGIEFYLIEQEGSEYSEFETAQRCLAAYRKMRSA
jgi:sugar phosphate isomerase/epimerase